MVAEFKQGFLLSEIESTLSLEGVRSTRQQIIRLQKNKDKDIVDKNDRIVKNMLNAYEYIQDQPITEKTIFELYQILTYQSLASTDQIKKGQFYRDGPVSIYNSQQVEIDRGVRFDLLPTMMKALVDYTQQKKDLSGHLIASHVVHYALIYIHPYFDYNGRMARVLSYWYNLRYAPSLSLLMVASMINHPIQKKGYYQAIQASRQMGNDLTYFLDYMGTMMIAHLEAYDHQHRFLMQLKSKGIVVSRGEALMMKDILLMPVTTQGYFTWKDYQSSRPVEDSQSKQYLLRLLQRLVLLEFLTVIEVSKQKLFKLHPIK
jgi:Fic family protein